MMVAKLKTYKIQNIKIIEITFEIEFLLILIIFILFYNFINTLTPVQLRAPIIHSMY